MDFYTYTPENQLFSSCQFYCEVTEGGAWLPMAQCHAFNIWSSDEVFWLHGVEERDFRDRQRAGECLKGVNQVGGQALMALCPLTSSEDGLLIPRQGRLRHFLVLLALVLPPPCRLAKHKCTHTTHLQYVEYHPQTGGHATLLFRSK